MPNQFDNPNNPLSHYGDEQALRYTNKPRGRRLCGRNGHFRDIGGTGVLREKIRNIKIVAVEPTIGNKLQGLKNMKESIVPGVYSEKSFDEKITVEDEDAFQTTRELVAKEGIFCGMSSGAAVAGVLNLAAKMKKGVIVTVLADRGDRYLSTHLFRLT